MQRVQITYYVYLGIGIPLWPITRAVIPRSDAKGDCDMIGGDMQWWSEGGRSSAVGGVGVGTKELRSSSSGTSCANTDQRTSEPAIP